MFSRKFVLIAEKLPWLSDGARKPVLRRAAEDELLHRRVARR